MATVENALALTTQPMMQLPLPDLPVPKIITNIFYKIKNISRDVHNEDNSKFIEEYHNEDFSNTYNNTIYKSENKMNTTINENITQTMVNAIQLAEQSCGALKDRIEEVDGEQQKFNEALDEGSKKAESLGSKIKNSLGSIDWKKGIESFIKANDYYADIRTKVNFIQDGKANNDKLYDQIYKSASNARTSGADMADMVGKFNGSDFKSGESQVAFTELLSKGLQANGNADPAQYMDSLASAFESKSISGDVLGEMFKNIPQIEDTMTKTMGKSKAQLLELANSGQISAQAIKNAMFQSSDGINEKFKALPMTFSDITTVLKNTVTSQLYPVFEKFGQWLSSDQGVATIGLVTNVLSQLASIAGWLAEKVLSIAGFFANNWAIIAPIIMGIVGALAFYNTVQAISSLLTTISSSSVGTFIKNLFAQKLATDTAAVAQGGLNMALLSCPITWIVLAIIALVAIIYAVVAAINKFTGSTISATGIIAGAFMVLLAVIGNILITIVNFFIDKFALVWDFIAIFVEFFANVFSDPVGSIMHLFANLATWILDKLGVVANGIDTLFGTSFGETIEGWKKNINDFADEAFGEQKIKIDRFDADKYKRERFDYSDAYGKGYAWGEEKEEMFKNNPLFNAEPLSMDTDQYLDQINDNTKGTEGNTNRVADSVDLSNESIAYMRDLAEQEVINRFTTSEIKVDMSNQFGDIKETVDVNGVISYLETELNERLVSNVEGVCD